ncbi:MAG: sensor histidine kinase [Gemmataceae bacterium]
MTPSPPPSSGTLLALHEPARRAVWSYFAGLAPGALVWICLVGWLAYTLYDSARWSERADEATIREWLDEARNFRKTLPEQVREYVRLQTEDPTQLGNKQSEIEELTRSLVEPTRIYINQLPAFPEILSLQVTVPATDPSDLTSTQTFGWVSNLPRPRNNSQNLIRTLRFNPHPEGDSRLQIVCEYRLHAYNRLQQQGEDTRRVSLVAGSLLVAATILAILFIRRFLERERRRELQRLHSLAEAEHQERELLESRLQQREAERQQQFLNQQLLEQQLAMASAQQRAAEAESTASEMRTQLYASIGIMAGSYAHNIKNLLVRPNDLIHRCIEVNGLSHEQEGMLSEVRSTLGTVNERLQQILRTVRRDTGLPQLVPMDLGHLLRDTFQTWQDLARDKWKLTLELDAPTGPTWIQGDHSHLQQAIENLLFNARDATFERRNELRELARQGTDAAARKERLLESASWRGHVQMVLRMEPDAIVLTLKDNGIGMTETVRAQCLTTHFSTKRDNALYEGYSAGMGLGLSFVAMVLENHTATLTIDSAPRAGATFTIRFPRPAAEAVTSPAPAAPN